jgi:hypothetical protein
MTAHRDPDRLISAFLMEGQTVLADPIYDAVRATIEHRAQRVVFGPWRMPDLMNRFVAIGLGAAAVVAVLAIGLQFLPSTSGGVGGAPSASPSPTPSPTPAPSTSAASSPSPVTAPPLSGSFTSTLHGVSMSIPDGWTTRAATAPWTASTFPVEYDGKQTDVVYDPVQEANLFLTVASQPLGASTPDAWVAQQMGSDEGCAATEPVTVDGAAGQIGLGGCNIAVATTGGRGYWIQLYTSGDDPAAVAPYDRAWFQSVLATVKLSPEDALDTAPSASP